MTLEEGLKLPPDRNGRIEIPDVSRDDLPAFFFRNGLLRGAEIGVYKGWYTQQLLEAGLEVYGIDPFLAFDDYGAEREGFQERQNYLAFRIGKVLGKYPKFHFVRKTSMDAVKDFKPGDLDFVYIDGHHGFKYVAEDLWEWTKIVRPGGIISGHDYTITKDGARDECVLHVRYALDGFLAAKHISPLYILGERFSKPGEKRDKWRSWMFVNPGKAEWCNREVSDNVI